MAGTSCGSGNGGSGGCDEGATRACSTTCRPGVETCRSGAWVGCTAPGPSPEKCDGIDNDCATARSTICIARTGRPRRLPMEIPQTVVADKLKIAVQPINEIVNGHPHRVGEPQQIDPRRAWPV